MAEDTVSMTLRHVGDSVSVAVLDDPSEARHIRRLLRGLLTAAEPGRRADAVLAVSELVTNALIHGRPPRVFCATIGRDGLRLDITDASREPAVVAEATTAVGGQGLRIVDRLSVSWGSELVPPGDNGKHVWCTIDGLYPSD